MSELKFSSRPPSFPRPRITKGHSGVRPDSSASWGRPCRPLSSARQIWQAISRITSARFESSSVIPARVCRPKRSCRPIRRISWTLNRRKALHFRSSVGAADTTCRASSCNSSLRFGRRMIPGSSSHSKSCGWRIRMSLRNWELPKMVRRRCRIGGLSRRSPRRNRRSRTAWLNRSRLFSARSGSGTRLRPVSSEGSAASSWGRAAASGASCSTFFAAWSGCWHPAAASF